MQLSGPRKPRITSQQQWGSVREKSVWDSFSIDCLLRFICNLTICVHRFTDTLRYNGERRLFSVLKAGGVLLQTHFFSSYQLRIQPQISTSDFLVLNIALIICHTNRSKNFTTRRNFLYQNAEKMLLVRLSSQTFILSNCLLYIWREGRPLSTTSLKLAMKCSLT